MLLVLACWMVRGVDYLFDLELNRYGLIPLKFNGLIGVLTSPFLHADLSHLSANTLPMLILGALLFYFYRGIAWSVLLLIWVLTGLWVWSFARGDAVHIGASGIIYGLASFLFFSGIIRRETGLMVITLLVTFVYGGLIWGVFPHFFPKENISWESHLMGLLAGLVLSVYFRRQGPQRKKYLWEDEEENEEEDEADTQEINDETPTPTLPSDRDLTSDKGSPTFRE